MGGVGCNPIQNLHEHRLDLAFQTTFYLEKIFKCRSNIVQYFNETHCENIFLTFCLSSTNLGTDEERGLAHWKKQRGTNLRRSKYLEDRISATYDLPIPTRLLWKIPAARYIPFLPTFQCQPPDSPIVHRAEMKRILETDTNGTICEV